MIIIHSGFVKYLQVVMHINFFDKFVQDTSSPPLHRSSPYFDPFDPHTYLRIRIKFSIWIYDLILQESSD